MKMGTADDRSDGLTSVHSEWVTDKLNYTPSNEAIRAYSKNGIHSRTYNEADLGSEAPLTLKES